MSQLGTVAGRILDAVCSAPGCQLDDLVLSVPELTWNQVFLEVDHLSRTGQVRVTARGKGRIQSGYRMRRKEHDPPIISRDPRKEANHDRGCSGISDRPDRSRADQQARR
jgi:hypothetical protein